MESAITVQEQIKGKVAVRGAGFAARHFSLGRSRDARTVSIARLRAGFDWPAPLGLRGSAWRRTSGTAARCPALLVAIFRLPPLAGAKE
jgi:hypothetical protein